MRGGERSREEAVHLKHAAPSAHPGEKRKRKGKKLTGVRNEREREEHTQLATELGVVPALLVKVDGIADGGDGKSTDGGGNDGRGLHCRD